MTTTFAPIQGTFDIALARNTLRQKINQECRSVFLTVKASTALTALGELILHLDRPEGNVIKIVIDKSTGQAMVTLSCKLRLDESKPSRWEEFITNLRVLSSQLEIEESGININVEARILER